MKPHRLQRFVLRRTVYEVDSHRGHICAASIIAFSTIATLAVHAGHSPSAAMDVLASCSLGGATVAVRTHDGNLALVLGYEQGSVSVTMPVTVNPDGTMASATVADAGAVTRTSYTPYGQLRGADNLALDRGWLGQVEDRADATTGTGTGLTYLNARYYDPVLARFISPGPFRDLGNPQSFDGYAYSFNNPVGVVQL